MSAVINAVVLRAADHFKTELAEAHKLTGNFVDLTPEAEWFSDYGFTVREISPIESDQIVFTGHRLQNADGYFDLYLPPAEWQAEVSFVVDHGTLPERTVDLALGDYIGNVLARTLYPVAA